MAGSIGKSQRGDIRVYPHPWRCTDRPDPLSPAVLIDGVRNRPPRPQEVSFADIRAIWRGANTCAGGALPPPGSSTPIPHYQIQRDPLVGCSFPHPGHSPGGLPPPRTRHDPQPTNPPEHERSQGDAPAWPRDSQVSGPGDDRSGTAAREKRLEIDAPIMEDSKRGTRSRFPGIEGRKKRDGRRPQPSFSGDDACRSGIL
jgi:hypothetical protein